MRLINQIHPRALDTTKWPTVLASALPDAVRQRFETLKGALDDYLRGAKPAEIKASYGVSRAWLNKKLHDCLDTGEDGRIQGYRGLLKHAARKEYVRVSRVRRFEHDDGRGTAGAFGKLLRDYPFVRKMVTKAMGGRNGTSIKEAGLNVRALHKQILDWLKQKGVGADEYPFNTASNGYFGLCRYITSRLLAGERAVALAKFGEASQSGLMAGTGKVSWLRANRPLSIVCYDEQALPLIGTLLIEMDGQEIEVPMERCSLCVFADEASQAILGYFISMRRRINTSDVLRALEHVLTPWQPRELAIEGMRYGEGAGLPAGVVQNYLGSRICLLRLDNDPVHYADAIIDYAAERTGMIMQFGQPGRWIARIVVERVFSQLQLRFLGRVPSTTGSGPSDPAVDDPVGKAVALRIRMTDVLEVIDVALATINATRQASLYNKTPLEVLAQEFSTPRGCVIPKWNKDLVSNPRFPLEICSLRVTGNQADGDAPHIQHIGGDYTNPLLRQSWSMIGQRLLVHIHDDFRTLQTYREDGTEFGPLGVTGHWARSYHTKRTRQEIVKAIKEDRFSVENGEDPVAKWMQQLARQALERAAKNRPKTSRQANQLAASMGPDGPRPFKTTKEQMAPPAPPYASKPMPGPGGSGSRWRSAFKKESK